MVAADTPRKRIDDGSSRTEQKPRAWRTGHIRRDCRAPRCPECRAFGHEQDDCVRFYARAPGRGVNDDYADDGMDEEEAERAAAPSAAPTPGVTDYAPGTVLAEDSASPPKPPATAAPATPPAAERQSEASQESDLVGAAPVPAVVSPEQTCAHDSDDQLPPRKKPRSKWTREWLARVYQQGAYENLMRELALEDSEAYRRWIWMDTGSFEDLLARVKSRIEKRDTNFRLCVPAGERLAITLRYLN
ncbi:hypothetical protein HPB47_026520 [Ixodes persulcatus]|uniref:Uncharacterized protein n=1 Tax=Ixodes persulcatus TaxID=34615 RepID=A0AC60PZ61_IXOPE|nr:hypothetical protein HPB47_026520 [Ixodes persulcatus]